MKIPIESEPVIYLDFDGVLFPFDNPAACEKPQFEVLRINLVSGYMPEVVERLVHLDVETVWCTSRSQREMNELTVAMQSLRGIRSLLPHPAPNKSRMQSKLDVIVRDQLYKPRPFAWVDDQINGAIGRAVELELSNTPHILIQPKRTVGIDEHALRDLENFKNEHSVR